MEDHHILRAPTKREKKRIKKKQIIPSSDESENSADEVLIKKGYPLEDSEEPQIEIVAGDFHWNKVGHPLPKLPWVKEIISIPKAGLKRIKKTEFLKKKPFQLLLSFIPLTWFEDITAETNRYPFNSYWFSCSILHVYIFNCAQIGMLNHQGEEKRFQRSPSQR